MTKIVCKQKKKRNRVVIQMGSLDTLVCEQVYYIKTLDAANLASPSDVNLTKREQGLRARQYRMPA